jgi:hypothetical protein
MVAAAKQVSGNGLREAANGLIPRNAAEARVG